ncbi:ABC transporter permease, partial [Robinsoniella sp.]
GAALFSGITVFLSVRKPAKKASGISSLEASKYVGDGLDSKKKTSKRKNGSRITHMAWANLGRNKTRTAFIMISLLLCTVLLNSVFVIAGSFDTDKWIKSLSKTDFIIASSSTFNNMKGFVHHDDALDENMVKAVEKQPGVKEGGRLYKNTLDDRNVSFEYGCRILDTEERDGYNYGITAEGESFTLADDNRPLCNAFGMSDAVLSRMTIVNGEKDLNVLREKLAEGNYIIEGVTSVRGNGNVSMKEFTSEIGQNIDAYVDGKKAKTFTVVAQAILNDVEYEVPSINTGVVQVGNDSPYFYMTQKDFESIYQNPALLSYSFDIDPKYELQMEEFLDEYIQNENPNASYNSVRLLKEDVWKTQQVVYVIGGIIGAVMGLAGMINFINMVITSILTRRHEFAAMQSIGMTKRQLNQMLTLEGIYYALGAGILGIITSGILGVTLVQMISSNIWFMTFRLTILPSVIICGIFLGIAVVVPSLSLKIFHKGSIVEQLRETE